MEISVIIPTHKPGDYIWECLHSIINQSFDKSQYEIIVVLNGCNEPWNTQINQFISSQQVFHTIKIIQTDIPGVSNARNVGLINSLGRYIAFIDDDDYVSPTYLENLYDKIDDNTITLSNSVSFIDGTNKFDDNYSLRRKYYELKDQNDLSLVKSRSLFNGPCMKLIPKNIIKDAKFDIHLKNGEDSLFMFEVSKNIKNIILSNESAIYYRRFRNSSATTRKKSLKEKISNTSKLIQRYFKVYFKSPLVYNTNFFITRVLATIKGHLILQ